MEKDNLAPVTSLTAIKIVDAAAKLFMQRGYRAVSINDIIKAAEITKPTLYYYFPDKEELFVQMGLRVLNQMGEQLCLTIANAPDTKGKRVALATMLMGHRDGDLRMVRHEMGQHLGPSQRPRVGQAFYANLFAPIHAVIEQGLADNELVGYNSSTLTTMFLSMCEAFHEFGPGAQTDHWQGDAGSPFTNLTISGQTLVDLFLNGVAGKQ